MQKYLRDSFARNKPYDRMVYELVTATGSTAPGATDYNGAANFLVMKLDENAAQATAMTAKIFLGLQVQCTQCHNHPFNEWKQQTFWEFNAFFRQTRALRTFVPGTRDIAGAQLTNQDFAGENNDPSEARSFYELRNGLLESSFPVFVDGTEVPKSGYLEECDRRTELGKLIVKSPFMNKTIANRMWQHFLGYGFTKPVDDLGPHNNPSHPGPARLPGRGVRPEQQSQPEGADPLDRAQRGLFAIEQVSGPRATRKTTRCWARRPNSPTFTCGRCGPKSCTNRCWSPRKPTKPAAATKSRRS